MSDHTLTVDPDGTVHASLEVDLPAEEPEQPEPADSDQPATNEATDALGNVIMGTAKAAGKVLKTVWDVLRPEGSQKPSSE